MWMSKLKSAERNCGLLKSRSEWSSLSAICKSLRDSSIRDEGIPRSLRNAVDGMLYDALHPKTMAAIPQHLIIGEWKWPNHHTLLTHTTRRSAAASAVQTPPDTRSAWRSLPLSCFHAASAPLQAAADCGEGGSPGAVASQCQ